MKQKHLEQAAHEAVVGAITAHIRLHKLEDAGFDVRHLTRQVRDVVDGLVALEKAFTDHQPINLLLPEERT